MAILIWVIITIYIPYKGVYDIGCNCDAGAFYQSNEWQDTKEGFCACTLSESNFTITCHGSRVITDGGIKICADLSSEYPTLFYSTFLVWVVWVITLVNVLLEGKGKHLAGFIMDLLRIILMSIMASGGLPAIILPIICILLKIIISMIILCKDRVGLNYIELELSQK